MSLRHRLAHCGLVAAVVACLLIFFPRENVMRTAVLLCAVSPQPEALEWGASMRHFKASLIVLSPLGEAHPIGHTYFEQTRVLHVDLRSPLEGITRRFLWREALPVLNEADDEAAAVVFDAAALRICGEVIGALLQRTRGVVLLRHVSMDQADAVVDAYRAALVGTLGDVRAAQLQKRWPYPISPHFVAGRAAAVRRFVALVEAELRRVPDGFPATGGVVSAADAMSSEITLVEVPLHWAEQGCDRLAQCNGEHPVVVREGCDERACASSYHSFVTLEVPQSLPETLFDVIHDRRVVDLWERHEVLSWQPAAKEERFSHCRNGRQNVVITMEGAIRAGRVNGYVLLRPIAVTPRVCSQVAAPRGSLTGFGARSILRVAQLPPIRSGRLSPSSARVFTSALCVRCSTRRRCSSRPLPLTGTAPSTKVCSLD